jgi:assimilatory nitrate reductase catalytic subunit
VGRGRRAGASPARPRWSCSRRSADGEIKALWIACTNPAQSMPDQATVRARWSARVRRAAGSVRHHRDRAYADLLLPATTWGEKDGTVTNSERRISRVRAASARPARRAHDWEIAVDFARRLEAAPAPGSAISEQAALFPYDDAEAVWNEHRETTRGRDLDITGLSYAAARTPRRSNGRCPKARRRQARLYEDGVFPTADGRRASPTCRTSPGRAARRALPVLAEHRPPARPVARHEPHRHAGPPVRPRARAGGRDAPAGHGARWASGTATWCT